MTGLGDRSFAAAGSRLWNGLPTTLNQSVAELGKFKRLLETLLFTVGGTAARRVIATAPPPPPDTN